MKIGKATVLLKKAAAMCKSKTSLLTGRLLVLTALQRGRMTSVAIISHKIHALVMPDQERADSQRALVMRKVENRQAVVYGVEDMATDLSHQLALFTQEGGHRGCNDWTLHPIFSDDEDCYTEECDDEDDGDVLLDACHDDEEPSPSVMDVIRMNREVEGLKFNMEEEIDQAADMFIRRFRQQLSKIF